MRGVIAEVLQANFLQRGQLSVHQLHHSGCDLLPELLPRVARIRDLKLSQLLCLLYKSLLEEISWY